MNENEAEREQAAAQRIRDAARALNIAIRDGVKAGLRAEVYVTDTQTIDEPWPVPRIEVRISREP